MKLAGALTISKLSHSRGASVIRIALEDRRAGHTFVEATVALEAFAEALTGLGNVTCELDVRALERVGLVRETKRESVGPLEWNSTDDERRAAGAVHETDGWRGHYDDASNSNKSARTDTGQYMYSVGYVRWVPAESSDEGGDGNDAS